MRKSLGIPLLIILLFMEISSLRIKAMHDKPQHSFFRSFFGKIEYQSEQQNYDQTYSQQPPQTQYNQFSQTKNLNSQQNKENQILINGNPYNYIRPFTLYCYDSQQNLIRQDRCSNEVRCKKLIQQYQKCPGFVKYKEVSEGDTI